MTFKEKVQSMAAKEIIMAMVNGLKKQHVKINMGTYGSVEDGICYGCAATNTVCEIAGVVFPSAFIQNYRKRAKYLGELDEKDIEFLSGFEYAIDLLRQGFINWYNDIAKDHNFAIIEKGLDELPPLDTDTYLENLSAYEELAEQQR